MSERGSFITEYIYCDKCFEACKEVLNGNDKYLNTRQIAELPIIAGKIGGLYACEEIYDMRDDYIPEIQEKMCAGHKIRIAVMAEQGTSVFEFDKDNIIDLVNEGENEIQE